MMGRQHGPPWCQCEVRRAAQVVVVVGQGASTASCIFVEAVFPASATERTERTPSGEGALSGGFEPGIGVGLGPAQDPEAGADSFVRDDASLEDHE